MTACETWSYTHETFPTRDGQSVTPSTPVVPWTEAMAADSPKTPGHEYEKIRTLGKYQIVKRLGAGGMGAVFLATDTDLKRQVALKVLPKDRAENPTLIRRFKAEAQAVAQLRHANIVAIYETGELQGFPYLALEYIDGPDLLSLIDKKGPIPPKRSLKIIRQIADALQHAYEKNIVHRDIKPSNLLIQTDGTTKITDFGLARSVDETLDTSITRAGTTVGTVDYISPEQACDSKAADIRSDLYSLGCTWYHMLTGQPPFPDGNIQNKLHDHINSPPPNPRQINSNVPEAYVAVIHQLMAKRPQDRYQTPADLIDDLDQVAGAASNLNAELFDEPTPKASPKSKSGRSPSAKESPPGQRGSAPSDGAAFDAVPKDDAPPSKINEKWRGRGGPVRKMTPSRGLGSVADEREEVAADDGDGSQRKSRKLPPRQQQDAGGFAIDIDFLRIGLIAIVVAAAVGLFWFAFSRGGQWSSNDGPAIARPTPEAPPAPPPVAPTAPAAPVVVAPTAVVTTEVSPTTAAEAAIHLADAPVKFRREGPPLTGMDDLSDLNSKAARELAPDWALALRQVPRDTMPTVTLETSASPAALDAALARQSGPQRRILLKGPGPFTLRPSVVSGCEHLVIEAAEGSEPVVLLEGRPNTPDATGHLHLLGGVLELRGLHLIAGVSSQSQPRPVLSVTGGTLIFAHGSVTVPNESGHTIVAQAVESQPRRFPSRVWIDTSLLRGVNMTAASLRGDRIDVLVTGSLLLSGGQPLISAEVLPPSVADGQDTAATSLPTTVSETAAVANNDTSGPQTVVEATPSDPSTSEPPLTVRLVGSVLSSGGELLQLKQAASSDILRGAVRLHRTLCGSRRSSAAVLLHLPQWPARSTSISGQPKVAGLSWQMNSSWLADWPTLLKVGTEVVSNPEDWANYLGRPLESSAVGTTISSPAVNIERATADWAQTLRTQVPAEVAVAGHVGLPRPLPIPRADVIDRMLLFAARPQLPGDLVKLPPSDQVLTFDLKSVKGDINELLNGPGVPDGAHVQFSGIGLVGLKPVRLRGKSLRLEFVQAGEGAPLTIRPESNPGTPSEAWMEVDGGRLDLIGAFIQASPSKTRESPPTLVRIRDADFSLRNCRLEGAPIAEPDAPGLIDWIQSKSGSDLSYGLIQDTQSVGNQTLISADVDRRLLVVTNNLLASRDNGIELRSRVGAANVARADEGWVMLEHNTFLFGRSALRFEGLTTGRESPAVRILADANVFTPAPGGDAAVLLEHPKTMTADNLFDWWGSYNGYAPALKRYRSTEADDVEKNQDFTADWVRFWTADHVTSPHIGLNSVLLSTALSSLNDLSPPLVALNRSSSGYSGSKDGSPIGIRPDVVGPLRRMATPSPSGTTPSTGQPGKVVPPANRPAF